MSSPRVSVIIPTYNRAAMLMDAIDSVLNQTFRDFEIIVVDDGSTDYTKETISRFNSPKISYSYQENCGRSNARNKAISKARGEYIAFLDSDDIFLPDKLEKQVHVIETQKDYGMVYTSAIVVDHKGDELYEVDSAGNKNLLYEARDSGLIYDRVAFYIPVTIILSSVMLRADLLRKIGGFDEKLNRFEDTDMWRRIAKQYKIFAISEPLCIIRSHLGNRMEDPDKVYKSVNDYVLKIFREDKDIRIKFKRRGASALHFHYGYAVYLNEEYSKYFAIKFFIRSLRYLPVYCIEQCIKKIAMPALYRRTPDFLKKTVRYFRNAFKKKN